MKLLFAYFFLFSLGCFAQTTPLIPFHKDKKWGYCQPDQTPVIAAQYRIATAFKAGVAWVQNDKKQWALLNLQGKLLTPFVYAGWQRIEKQADTLFIVKMFFKADSLTGCNLLNCKGQELLAWKYTALAHAGEGFYKAERHFFANETEKKLLESKDLIIDLKGNEYLLPKRSGNFSGGFAQNNCNYYTPKGHLQIATQAYFCFPFSEGLAVVRVNPKQEIVINSANSTISKKTYQPLFADDRLCREGLLPIQLNDLQGFIDQRGEEVIPPLYDEVRHFSEGLAPVRMGNVWGVINKKGRLVVPFLYDLIEDFSEGKAVVEQKGAFGVIDKEGKVLAKPQYDRIEKYQEGMAKVEFEGCVGFLNSEGQLAVPIQYKKYDAQAPEGLAFEDKMQKGFEQGIFYLEGYGYIDQQGKTFFDPAQAAPTVLQDLDKYNTYQLAKGMNLKTYRNQRKAETGYSVDILFADLDQNQTSEIVLRTYTGGMHCCYQTEILEKNKADNLYYSIANTSKDITPAPALDAQGKQRLVVSYYEDVAYYHSCYACEIGLAVYEYDLYLENSKLVLPPTDEERNKKITKNMGELSKMPLRLLKNYDEPFLELATIMKEFETGQQLTDTDEGERKAYLYNCIGYYLNNQRDLAKTKALFEQYYTFKLDKAIIWAEIAKLLREY